MFEFLAQYTAELASLGAVATVLSLGVAFYWRQRETWGLQAAKAKEFRQEAQTLADRANITQGYLDVWETKVQPDQVPDAERLMKEFYSLYQLMYLAHSAGTISKKTWKTAVPELQDFVSFGYVQSNLDFADRLDPEFGTFMRGLTPKRRN